MVVVVVVAVSPLFAGDISFGEHRHHNHHNHHSHHRHHPHSHNPHKHTPAPIPPKAPPVPKMPCKMQTCEMVCKLVDKKLGEGKYAITYQEKVCAFDAKCEAANAKCVPQLIALMKAAEAAEQALKTYQAMKKEHLHAQGKFKGKASAEMK